MIDLVKIRDNALPGDIILTGGANALSFLIRNGQRPQTIDGKPSRWSHSLIYIDSETVAESTLDFEPYEGTGKRLDNGAQFNSLDTLAECDYGQLMCMDWLTMPQRQDLITEAKRLIDKGYTYPISGLLGSLLSYWIFGWKSNPLQSRHSLYCSAFIQEVYNVIPVEFDPKHTARNTCPEMLGRYANCRRVEL